MLFVFLVAFRVHVRLFLVAFHVRVRLCFTSARNFHYLYFVASVIGKADV
jgi:hypothetical protein